MKRKMIMYLHGDIATDARVNRAAAALSDAYNLILISTDCGMKIHNEKYRNILISTKLTGIRGLFLGIWKTFQIIRKEKPDVVYCHDYYSSILAYIIKKTSKIKVIYDAHELIIPDKNSDNLRMSLFRWFEKRIVNKVDLLICASKERGVHMREYYKLKSDPIVINNISKLQINNDDFTLDTIKRLDAFFSHPGLVLVYAGVVVKSRKIISLLDVAIKKADKYKLLIIGSGNALDEIKNTASRNNNLKIACTGKIPYDSLGAILSKCDIGFVYYPTDTLNNILCASNKIYEYTSVSLPIVSNENPTVRNILNSNNIGIASNNLEGAIESVVNNLDFYKEQCRKFSNENSWEKEAALLIDAIDSVVN